MSESAVRHSKQEGQTIHYFDKLWNRAEYSSYEGNLSVASIQHLLSQEIQSKINYHLTTAFVAR